MPDSEIKVVAQNRKARHDYFVEETFEAGIELRGTEVKSIRLGKCNLKDCYAAVEHGEMLVYGMHIMGAYLVSTGTQGRREASGSPDLP